MNILVTGAEGLLGSEFVQAGRRIGATVVGLGREGLDVTDRNAVERILSSVRLDLVVHCAAYTAVDRAEDEPDIALRVNRDGSANVARAAAAAGCPMVYISTDYVFAGDAGTPYKPEDPVGPRSTYARSKLEGEIATQKAFEGVAGVSGPLVVRTGWLYGAGGPNFVRTILQRGSAGKPLRVVADQRGRPTWARNVAETVLELMRLDVEGVWHVADGGDATWLELAGETLRLGGIETAIRGVSSEQWGAAAPRPTYSVLDISATEGAIGRPAMPWRDALRSYLEEEMGDRVVA